MTSFQDRSFPSSLSEDDLARAEQAIGTIPDGLRRQLSRRNGGVPEHGLFIDDEGDDYGLDYVFPVPESKGEPASQDLVSVNLSLRKGNLVPDHSLVFGSDPGGNYYSVDKRDGSVWYHPMDVWEDDLSPEENHGRTMIRLSETLDDFFASLTDED